MTETDTTDGTHEEDQQPIDPDGREFTWRNESNIKALGRAGPDYNKPELTTKVDVEQLQSLLDLAEAMEWEYVDLSVAGDKPVLLRNAENPEKALFLAPIVSGGSSDE
jgi:hypothetical protein